MGSDNTATTTRGPRRIRIVNCTQFFQRSLRHTSRQGLSHSCEFEATSQNAPLLPLEKRHGTLISMTPTSQDVTLVPLYNVGRQFTSFIHVSTLAHVTSARCGKPTLQNVTSLTFDLLGRHQRHGILTSSKVFNYRSNVRTHVNSAFINQTNRTLGEGHCYILRRDSTFSHVQVAE